MRDSSRSRAPARRLAGPSRCRPDKPNRAGSESAEIALANESKYENENENRNENRNGHGNENGNENGNGDGNGDGNEGEIENGNVNEQASLLAPIKRAREQLARRPDSLARSECGRLPAADRCRLRLIEGRKV